MNQLFDAEPEIVAGYPDKRQQPPFTVDGFSVVIWNQIITTTGNHFSKEMIDCFSKLRKCESIHITDIKVTDSRGNILPVEPITIRLECGDSFNPSMPVPELVCDGKFYKSGDTISIADVLADTAFITPRYNGFGEKVKNVQIKEFRVLIDGEIMICQEAGLSSSVKNILAEKSSDVQMSIMGIQMITTNEDGSEKIIQLTPITVTLRKDN